jgi:hypothetical protein
MSGKSDAAAHLYVSPPAADSVASAWASQLDYLGDRVSVLAQQYGPTSGLDPTEPYDNLRFGQPTPAGPGRQTVEIDIVRSQRVEDTILGIVPTATQENVIVEPIGTITLALVDEPPPDWLPFGRLSSQAWRIEDVINRLHLKNGAQVITDEARHALVHRAFQLSLISIVLSGTLGGIAVVIGLTTNSLSLLGFGFDAAIDSIASVASRRGASRRRSVTPNRPNAWNVPPSE